MSEQAPIPASVTISRMSSPEVIRLQVRVIDGGTEIIEFEMGLADFCLALTGRGEAPAKMVRRWHRKP